jgi:hypothetical protein
LWQFICISILRVSELSIEPITSFLELLHGWVIARKATLEGEVDAGDRFECFEEFSEVGSALIDVAGRDEEAHEFKHFPFLFGRLWAKFLMIMI